jgi:hypothetical protein
MDVSGNIPPAPAGSELPRIRFEAIGEAWSLMTQQAGTWALTMLAFLAIILSPYVICIVLGAISVQVLGKFGSILMGLLVLVGIVAAVVASFLCSPGLYRMAIRQVRGEPIEVRDLFAAREVAGNVFGASILMAFGVAIAEMLCVFPAFIVQGLWMLTMPLIVDKGMGPTEALTVSWNTLKREWVAAALFVLVLGVVVALGSVVTLGIGVLFMVPVGLLSYAIVYRDFLLTDASTVPFSGVPYPGAPYAPPVPYAPAVPSLDIPTAQQFDDGVPSPGAEPTVGFPAEPTAQFPSAPAPGEASEQGGAVPEMTMEPPAEHVPAVDSPMDFSAPTPSFDAPAADAGPLDTPATPGAEHGAFAPPPPAPDQNADVSGNASSDAAGGTAQGEGPS